MNEFIDKQCLSCKSAKKDYKQEWEATRYMIENKMFAMVGEGKSGRLIITLKLIPEKGELLRASFPDKVIAGYYMNKVHWNSFFLDIEQDEKLLCECINESYELILSGFSKKKQQEICNG